MFAYLPFRIVTSKVCKMDDDAMKQRGKIFNRQHDVISTGHYQFDTDNFKVWN